MVKVDATWGDGWLMTTWGFARGGSIGVLPVSVLVV